jgi:hypothetical protein
MTGTLQESGAEQPTGPAGPAAGAGVQAARVALRIWVPDRPGVLGAVATRVGGIRGNVVGLEVLEREGGVAVDELMVELPDPGLVDLLCRQVRLVEGVGVEDVRVVGPDEEERGLEVMSAALAILETANSGAALSALMGFAQDLFELDWATLTDLESGAHVHSMGEIPSVPWLAAFIDGARVDGTTGRTDGSGVLAELLEVAGVTLFLGRSVPFRRRERREMEMLARITDRVWSALQPHPAGRSRW